MLDHQLIDTIELQTIASLKEQYDSIVPHKLLSLDEERYVTIPQAVEDRGEQAHLTKDELVNLVVWKVSHGKFRPTLKGLAMQNADEFVQEVTGKAFKLEDNTAALKELTKLRGVGPATAALLLAVRQPNGVPFFSDELFRWCFFEDKPGHGWDRKIKYTPKEYSELVDKVNELRARLCNTVSAVDIEKAAYVLGKRAVPATTTADSNSRKRKASSEALEVAHGPQQRSRRSTRKDG